MTLAPNRVVTRAPNLAATRAPNLAVIHAQNLAAIHAQNLAAILAPNPVVVLQVPFLAIQTVNRVIVNPPIVNAAVTVKNGKLLLGKRWTVMTN